MEHSQTDKHRIPHKKIWILASGLVILLAIGTLSAAWLNYQRSLSTLTAINEPIHLYLKAGHGEDVARLYLGDIDVKSQTEADYVFSVESGSEEDYILQLAHTTNIGFTYEIYRATESTQSTEGAVPYVDEQGDDYYYSYAAADKLAGAYLNRSNDTGLANQTFHETTYGTYSYVQKNAEPLYWQGTVTPSRQQADGDYLDYFVLHITWTKDSIENNKETDIIYLTAGRAGSEGN
jgi:hypothetical protein